MSIGYIAFIAVVVAFLAALYFSVQKLSEE